MSASNSLLLLDVGVHLDYIFSVGKWSNPKQNPNLKRILFSTGNFRPLDGGFFAKGVNSRRFGALWWPRERCSRSGGSPEREWTKSRASRASTRPFLITIFVTRKSCTASCSKR